MKNIIHSIIRAMIFLVVTVNSTLELKTWIWVYPQNVIGLSVDQAHVTYGHDYSDSYNSYNSVFMFEYLDLITNETVNIANISWNNENIA